MSSNSPANEAKIVEFFDETYARFQQALKNSATPLIIYDFEIGGRGIRLQFAGQALVPYFTPALEHLKTASLSHPDLTICLWDSASTGVPMLPAPWAKREFEHQGEILEFNTDRMGTLFQPGEDTLNLLDQKRNLAVVWRRDNRGIPYYTTSSPLRSIFHWWMSGQGKQFLHGAAVGTKEGGVLIVGKGGSGKSTTALSCLASPLLYVGDDYVLLGMENGPYVYSLYSSAKLNTDQMRRFPGLEPFVFNKKPSEEDKTLVLLNRPMPHKIVRGFPIRAIFIPRITGKPETSISKATSVAAFAALAPSTMFQLTRNREKTFSIISRVVKEVPAYYLECGTVIEEIPGVIENFLHTPQKKSP